VHDGGGGRGGGRQRLRDGLGDGLGARQGLHLHRVDVEHVACWDKKRESRRPQSDHKKGKSQMGRFILKLIYCLFSDLVMQTYRFPLIKDHAVCNTDIRYHSTRRHLACYGRGSQTVLTHLQELDRPVVNVCRLKQTRTGG